MPCAGSRWRGLPLQASGGCYDRPHLYLAGPVRADYAAVHRGGGSGGVGARQRGCLSGEIGDKYTAYIYVDSGITA